jgi:hypothetical protein
MFNSNENMLVIVPQLKMGDEVLLKNPNKFLNISGHFHVLNWNVVILLYCSINTAVEATSQWSLFVRRFLSKYWLLEDKC